KLVGQLYEKLVGLNLLITGDFEVMLIVMAFRWKLIRLATFFSTCQPVKYPQIFTFISQYQ
ncbi:hypothetical protein, partial [uncultured Prevotella sp.]|uniref:hypothetical protein n=1 Tax=uncultured Prevotella sp. TaxID=159272 RepID=UPI00258425B1